MQIQQTLPSIPSTDSARKAAVWLKENGLPHNRLEHWRMTPVQRLLKQDFVRTEITDDVQELVAYYRQKLDVASQRLLVLVAGDYRADLSDLAAEGIEIIADSADHAEIDFQRLPFAAQNLSIKDRASLTISLAAGATVEGAVHLLNIVPSGTKQASFAHTSVNIATDARITLVESHLSQITPANDQEGFSGFSNSLVRVSLGEAAHLSHYKWQQLDEDHAHVAASISTLAAKAELDAFVLNMGGKLVRQDSEVVLAGSEATAILNGAYVACHTQHIDNTSQIKHDAPDSYSREVYKGVLSDEGQGVFQARIRVDQCAQRTDAYQMNRALLLSPQSEVRAKPELEIYADDVKCSHGATVGQLDEDQLFYLVARGISRKQAQMMLIEAYLEDVFADMHDRNLANQFAQIARDKLHNMAINRNTA